MATEKLKFKLELYATMWDKPPHAEILVDGKSYFDGDITSTEDKPTLIEFEAEIEEDKKCDLIINRSNKTVPQTVVNDKGDLLNCLLYTSPSPRDPIGSRMPSSA